MRCGILTTTLLLLILLPSSLRSDDVVEDDELLREIVSMGRGDRDAVGVRDQWESAEHLQVGFDSRRPVSSQVRKRLDAYRLDCPGCDHEEAVQMVNAFVAETKRVSREHQQRDEVRARRAWWLRFAATLVTALALGITVSSDRGNVARMLGGMLFGVGDGGGHDEARRRWSEIEEQRRRAARKEEQDSLVNKKEPPTWRDNEEREVWTPKQEKQFGKALTSFGGIPPKARYILIADKVDGKSRLECLMHHKLLQLQSEEEEKTLADTK